MSARVRFNEETTKESEEAKLELDPEVASRLFNEAGFLVLKDVPPGTEIGIDMRAWNTGDRFLGIKLIPPGIHYVYYSAVNTADRSTAPRFVFLLHSFRWPSS
jgi:A1 cistron-splicing factor AAR2